MVRSDTARSARRLEAVSDEARSSPAGARHTLPDRYGPGRKELAVSAALVLVGFVVWFAGSPGATSWLFGVEPPRWPEFGSALDLFRVAIVIGALALVGGFVFHRGFYLWGVALSLHGPLGKGLSVYRMYLEGLGLVGGTRAIVGYAIISAMLFVFAIACYTALSALGAGVRYLLGRGARR
jgi:hypothetical protein